MSPDEATRSILIVDDERDLADLAAEALSELGYKVHTAYNGLTALEILSSGEPIQLVFSDIKMPKLDGVSLLKKIKADFPGVAVCMISGFSAHSEKDVLSYGALGYLSKPYSIDALIEFADRHFGVSQSISSVDVEGTPLVFVVEDEAIDQDLLKRSFAQLGVDQAAEFRFFFDGESFLRGLAESEKRPRLIILDINLPGISGLETLAKAKAARTLPESTSVIVLTSSKLEQDYDRAHDLDVDSVYTKPMDRAAWWHLARAIHQSWLLPKSNHAGVR